eukprot:s2207_g6.t1
MHPDSKNPGGSQALKGLAEIGEKEGRQHFITQASEHVAVLEVCKALEQRGCQVTYLPVDSEGMVSPDAVEAAMTPRTICISIMHSNNETGALQPIREIVMRARKAPKRAHPSELTRPRWEPCKRDPDVQIFQNRLHTWSLGKLPVNVKELDVDLLTIAGHKLYAPKGVGALYRRCTVPDLPPLLHGAGQEAGRRASTENVIHIVGLGKACEIAARDLPQNQKHMQEMRDRLGASSLALGDGKACLGSSARKLRNATNYVGAHLMRQNGPAEARLPNTLSASFYKVEANTLLSEVADEVAASAGAACHSDEVHMSHVLEDWAMGTCRFTLGRESTAQEVDRAAKVLAKTVLRLMPDAQAWSMGLRSRRRLVM